MANPNPAFYDAPAVNPAGLGLYAAAALIDVPLPTMGTPADSRIQRGVIIRPFNCADGSGTWPTTPCLVPLDPDLRKTGLRADNSDPFLPLTVWGYDECGPREWGPLIKERAAQNLRLNEPLLVESDFATRLLADAAAPTVVADIIAAVSELEVQLGNAGYIGTIHASRKFAAYADRFGLIQRTSGAAILRTPLGHAWSFGGGYDDVLEDTLVATGPVTVWREPVVATDDLDQNTNSKFSLTERNIVVGYECLVTAVTVDPTP